MAARLGNGRIGFKKCRFDEKDVGALCKPYNSFNVGVGEGAIDNIGNLSARGYFHDLLLEETQRESRRRRWLLVAPRDINQRVIRRSAKRCILEGPQPRANGK